MNFYHNGEKWTDNQNFILNKCISCEMYVVFDDGSIFGFRHTVMVLMQEIDSEAVQIRARRRWRRQTYLSLGPNHTWHIDGYSFFNVLISYVHNIVTLTTLHIITIF